MRVFAFISLALPGFLLSGGKVQHTDTLIQSAQKVGTTVAVASTPISFIESSIQIASLTIGLLGLIVAGFSAWVNYQRLKYQKEIDQQGVQSNSEDQS